MKSILVVGAVLAGTLLAGNATAAAKSKLSAGPETAGVSLLAGYTNMSFSSDGDTFDSNGHSIGARAVYASNGWFAKGEYAQNFTSANYDGLSLGLDATEVRVGGGYGVIIDKGVNVYGEIDYVYQSAVAHFFGASSKANNRGYFFGVGTSVELIPNLTGYARIGYLTLKGNETDGNFGSGPDYLLGFGYTVVPGVSVLLETSYSVTGERGYGQKVITPRAGVKYSF